MKIKFLSPLGLSEFHDVVAQARIAECVYIRNGDMLRAIPEELIAVKIMYGAETLPDVIEYVTKTFIKDVDFSLLDWAHLSNSDNFN